MEFALSPELGALHAEAREVGLAASERAEIPEDTLITAVLVEDLPRRRP